MSQDKDSHSTSNHLKSALVDFHALKSNNQIPPQMLVKLQYLLTKIIPVGKKLTSSVDFQQLPQYERASLDQITKQTGIHLFINIINCLSDKDLVLYVRDQKMYIRKDESLTMWNLCYGTIDNNRFMIYKKPLRDEDKNTLNKKDKLKPAYQLELKSLKISKSFKQYKRKSVFGINYRDKQSYLIGFDQQSACARMHELLRSLIKEKMRKNINRKLSSQSQMKEDEQSNQNHYRQYSKNQQDFDRQEEYYTNEVKYRESLDQESSKLCSSNLSNTPISQIRNQYEQSFSFKKKNHPIAMNSKQIEKPLQQLPKQNQQQDMQSSHTHKNGIKQTILQYVSKEQLLCDESFKLLRNDPTLRQLTHKQQPNIFKQYVTINYVNVSNLVELIMQAYLLQNQWNSEIDDLKISKKLDDNIYQVSLKTKKYSYLSWARACKLYCMGFLKNEIGYLVLRNIQEQEINQENVTMSWNQIIQIRQNSETKKVYMVVLSQFDFKGYSSVEDSQKMGLKLMNSISKFPNFVESQIMLKKQKNIFKFYAPLASPMNNHSTQKQATFKRNRTRQHNEFKKQVLEPEYQFDDNNLKDSMELPDSMKSSKSSKPSNNRSNFLQFQKDEPKKLSPQINAPSSQDYKKYADLLYQTRFRPTVALLQKLKTSTIQNNYYLKHYFDQTPRLDLSRSLHEVQTIDNYINQGGIYTIRDNGDVVFYDPKVLELHKGVLKMILKQLGSNLMSGKSIMNMSLPVQLFDDKAILERVAAGYGYAPRFLTEAGETDDIVKQAQLIVLTIIGILPLHLNVTKPFNPILGETFECVVAGIPIYFEQISHHPPISAVLMKGQNFIFHGSFHSHAEMGLNQVVGRNLSPLFVEFPKTNTFYEIKMNDMEILGIMYGDRIYRGAGKMFIHERTNNIFVECSYGKEKKKVYELSKEQKINPNMILGGIYTVTQNFGNKFSKCENKSKFSGLKPDDIVEKHTQIKGHWGLDLFFNGKKVKSMKDPIPNKIEYPEYALPSDSNFRLDLLYRRLNKLKQANQEKQVLENIQRRDRKLRQGKYN